MERPSKTDHVVIGIHVSDRVDQASRVQEILTRHGRTIKTRIGLHEAAGRVPAPGGLILLELVGAPRAGADLMAALNAVAGVEAKSLVFEH